MHKFKLKSKFKPTGDQPEAIKALTRRIKSNKPYSTLLGVTGSGKTFTLASAIEKINRPILLISHNKTLASQLYAELKSFFPQNAVEYFVSYYDYYQPESYIPQTDTYIEKDASINDRLDRLRLSATSSLLTRKDVIVVASVSCIYNLGSPEEYRDFAFYIKAGNYISQNDLSHKLVELQYQRNDYDFSRGSFRIKGDVVDIYPAYSQKANRIEFFGETIEKIYQFDPASGKKITELDQVAIYPAKHFLIGKDRVKAGIKTIRKELEQRIESLTKKNKLLEAQRLRQRTLFDLEMLAECGWCHGIENYSRHLSGRPAGSRPYCLIDYFPKDFITIIDESHVTIPQIKGMYLGDKSRKETLVQHGFRLPSCLDNRPLRYPEFKDISQQTVFVSATPTNYEVKLSEGKVIEQIIRPTGLPDPKIKVRPTKNQIDDLTARIKEKTALGERTLITTLTKRMAEELTEYLKDESLSVAYIHSEIDTLERTKILRQLRLKEFDSLVGVNLLREGLDLPEVSSVVILDADKEGFLRSATSLIQVAGRCARNINGEVIMYADTITKSMQKAIQESSRRRKIQIEYNKKNNITPRSIESAVKEGIEVYLKEEEKLYQQLGLDNKEVDLHQAVAQLEKEMYIAAKNLHFEKAAQLRDKIKNLKKAIRKA
ncbi:MAG: excinuclease ABC subunit UvrB [Candidatus Omnitrophica bacterium]|nr:excinuclease ABC subunit UvrB [Candidatus Omnitrophota bacterium]MCF7894056.1 excinuclease ABC subunit UvrB [Candidatus Omnitrophota bacterium]